MLRRLLIGGVVLAIVVVAWVVLVARNNTTTIDYYELVAPQTIVIGATGAPGGWTRVTQVTETSTEVRIKVEVWDWLPGPATAYGVRVRLTVHLSEPLAGRIVKDQAGNSIQPARCTDNICSPEPSP